MFLSFPLSIKVYYFNFVYKVNGKIDHLYFFYFALICKVRENAHLPAGVQKNKMVIQIMKKKPTADARLFMAILDLERDIVDVLAQAYGMKPGTIGRHLLSLGIAQWARTKRLTDPDLPTPAHVAHLAVEAIAADKDLSAARDYLRSIADKKPEKDRLL